MFFGPHLVQTVTTAARSLPPSGTQIETGHKILRKQNIENKSVLTTKIVVVSWFHYRGHRSTFGDVLFGFLDLFFGDMILGCCTKHVVFKFEIHPSKLVNDESRSSLFRATIVTMYQTYKWTYATMYINKYIYICIYQGCALWAR